MSWNKTTVDGQTMYERSDGVRVSRTQDIEAIELQEKLEMEDWRDNQSNRFYYDDDMEEYNKDEINPVGLALVSVMMIALIIMFFTNN